MKYYRAKPLVHLQAQLSSLSLGEGAGNYNVYSSVMVL